MYDLFSYVTLLLGTMMITVAGNIIYQTQIRFILLMTSFYMMCLHYLDVLTITIVGLIMKDTDYMQLVISTYGTTIRIFQVLLCKMVMIIVYCVIKKYIKIRLNPQYIKHLVVILIFSMSGIIFLVGKTLEAINLEGAISWLVFSIIVSLVILTFVLYIHNKKEHYMLEIIKMRNKLIEEKYQGLNKVYMSNAKLYHDFKHHLRIIYQLMKEKEYSQAEDYMENLEISEQEILNKKWTGNQVVDIVLNSKISEMKKLEIRFQISVEFPHTTHIISNDMCSILSNLLENSIEACKSNKNIKNKWINIKISKVNKMVIVKIENGAENSPIIRQGNIITIKKDKNLHGWGMKSVESTVEKYGGSIKYRYNKNVFTVVAILNYFVEIDSNIYES